jgi:hypothetical protein
MVKMTATANTGKQMNEYNNNMPLPRLGFFSLPASSVPVLTRGRGFFLGEKTWMKA